jgi:hypothetical protein
MDHAIMDASPRIVRSNKGASSNFHPKQPRNHGMAGLMIGAVDVVFMQSLAEHRRPLLRRQLGEIDCPRALEDGELFWG